MPRILATLALLVALTGSVRGADKVTVKKMTYPQLGKAVRDLRGKVVVVYFFTFS